MTAEHKEMAAKASSGESTPVVRKTKVVTKVNKEKQLAKLQEPENKVEHPKQVHRHWPEHGN
jgi:hypothetical protein